MEYLLTFMSTASFCLFHILIRSPTRCTECIIPLSYFFSHIVNFFISTSKRVNIFFINFK